MKKQASWLLVAAFLSGMAGCGKKIPEDIIQPDAMESLLYDYHLASTMSSSVSYTENYKKDAYFKYVFQKHPAGCNGKSAVRLSFSFYDE